jgi:hypothetical protein
MPEIILINSHDATSAYQLRGGLYRFVCSNGLIVGLTEFGMIRVPHRGNVMASVVEGAREISRRMSGIGEVIESMARTELDQSAQLAFAQRALELRYRGQTQFPFDAGRLLQARRDADRGNDLWTVYNKVQEHVICGGIEGRTALGRRTTSRRIHCIDEDIRINVALWQEAMASHSRVVEWDEAGARNAPAIPSPCFSTIAMDFFQGSQGAPHLPRRSDD